MFDLFRNRIILVYTLLLAFLTFGMLNLDTNSAKALLSLLNITLLFVPVITLLFSTIYYFNSIEFIELLLSQPIRRKDVLLAEFTGLSLSLTLAYALGIGIPLLIMAPGVESLILVLSGVLLTLIFSSISLLIFVCTKDKTKGIGLAIVAIIFFSLLFDAILLALIYSFNEYPIDKAVVIIIAFNPIDLARILMLLQLDVAVLMGQSGALFKHFLGSKLGSIYSITCLLCWIAIPLLIAVKRFRKRDL